MPSKDEQSQLCERCKQRPATEKFTRDNTSEMLCAACFDWTTVYHALHDASLHFLDLEDREQYDEALACLDEILEANRHRDHEKWLARSIARERASIFFNAGRYAEAEKACEAWVALGIHDAGDRWMYGGMLAKTLDAQGRTREAVAALEDALSYRDPKDTPAAYNYLWRLAELSAKIGQPVDPKFRSLAEETAERNGVEMPQHESLGKAILDLADTIPRALRKRRGEPEPSDDDEDD
jgi:tetratricopeptide (TPR) repeat protein